MTCGSGEGWNSTIRTCTEPWWLAEACLALSAVGFYWRTPRNQLLPRLQAQTLQVELAPVLMLDNYLPFSPLQALIPFIAPPKPQWVGIGIISLYLTLFVTVTFKA